MLIACRRLVVYRTFKITQYNNIKNFAGKILVLSNLYKTKFDLIENLLIKCHEFHSPQFDGAVNLEEQISVKFNNITIPVGIKFEMELNITLKILTILFLQLLMNLILLFTVNLNHFTLGSFKISKQRLLI